MKQNYFCSFSFNFQKCENKNFILLFDSEET